MNDDVRQVALRIRELRDIFGYSVEDLTSKINLEASQYEQYESSGADIPISVIYKLANIYNVDMTEILSGKSPKLNTLSLVRRGEGLVVERYPGYEFENIGYKFMHRNMEPMIVTLRPDAQKPKFVTHSGQEINYCLEGEMIVYYDNNEVHLKPGDCVYFDPTHPHGQKAATNETAKFLTIIQE